jgi:1A family penicillin-binding protein
MFIGLYVKIPRMARKNPITSKKSSKKTSRQPKKSSIKSKKRTRIKTSPSQVSIFLSHALDVTKQIASLGQAYRVAFAHKGRQLSGEAGDLAKNLSSSTQKGAVRVAAATRQTTQKISLSARKTTRKLSKKTRQASIKTQQNIQTKLISAKKNLDTVYVNFSEKIQRTQKNIRGVVTKALAPAPKKSKKKITKKSTKQVKKKIIFDARRHAAVQSILHVPQKIKAFFFRPKKTKNKTKKKPTKKVVPVKQVKPTLFQLLYKETLAPFVYVFRYHPWITFFSIFFSAIILVSSYFMYDWVFKDLPDVTQLTQRHQILTTRILDRNGKLLYRIYKDENRTLIPLSRVPDYMKKATIAIEDKEFYKHRGISWRGIVRALRENTKAGGKSQGGSTITQQLVKNTLLTSEKTYKRKIREILLSFIVERTYTKDEILEMYFNEVPYGGSTYGIEEAAQRYFGKAATQLTLGESAFLAGLPAAPSVYSPFGTNPQLAFERQHEVLRRMVEDGYISQMQADAARNEQLHFRKNAIDIKAPHFVMYVKNLLEKQYGEDVVNQGGLEVRTTLDLDTQNTAQDIVTKEMETLERLRISNGAALITNPKTGEVIAMVGSKNYFDFENDGQVNVTMQPRQPGSSIKPLTYAVGFEQGMSPSTTIADEPITFHIAGSAPYSPKNYDGKFHGTVTIREALGSSFNIPAVKTLATVGISNVIDKAEEMGVNSWHDRSRFGLSLTLGGGEVMMTELSQIYGTFATYGKTVTLNPILEVRNAHGDAIYQNTCALSNTDCPATQTLDPKVAYEITDILTDNNARTPAFGPRSVLYIPGQQVAVKTGTTNNLKDNWSVGYTTDRVVAVWVGNNDGTPMSYVASGITGASPIWNKIIRTQLDDKNPHVFPAPEGMVKVKICTVTNTLPCSGCPSVRDELFIAGEEPKAMCNPAYFRPKPTPAPSPSGQILDGVSTQQ